jgi:hypothetical protein
MALVGEEHYRFDDSVWQHEGPVFDLGCLGWEWSAPFVGKRMVIGVDPQETTCPAGCTLVPAVVTPFDGQAYLHSEGIAASLFQVGPPRAVPAVTLGFLRQRYGQPALVKMNIEGAEFPLLIAEHHPIAPQLVVAFHGWQTFYQPALPPFEATEALVNYLSHWYIPTCTRQDLQWWVFLAKETAK